MKLNLLNRTTLCTTALLAAAGLTLAKPMADSGDRPKELAPQAQTEHPERAEHGEQAEQAPAQTTTYLGVMAKPIGPASAREMELVPGTGLRLMRIAPGSPAERAGLLAGDVLTHLDDQLLVNAEQFAVLIRSHQPGETATLKLVRDGEPMQVQAELAGREIEAPAQRPLGLLEPLDLPEPFADRAPEALDAPPAVRELFEQMNQRMNQRHQDMFQMLEQMRRQMQLDRDALMPMPELRPLDEWEGMGELDARRAVRSNVMVNDGEHIIRIKTDQGQRHLTVKTADGEVLYDGAMPEDGDVEGLPEAVQEKIDGLLKGNGIELRIRPAPRQQEAEPAGPVA